MSSRQEEKEQRKREREERERAAAAEAKRKRLLQILGGVAVAAVVVIGAVLILTGGGGGDRPTAGALRTAAKAAGCTYGFFAEEGRGHTAAVRTPANYKTNPPTSGDHNPNPAQDGLYATGNEPPIGNWVHTLEHGRIILQYKTGSTPATISALQKLFEEPVAGSGKSYHMVLMQNNTNMPFAAAAVAWRHYMGCKDASPAAIAAMRKFRDALVDKGPELIA
ncbi:MAG: hypothetical protein QOE11_953 [Solirubrobacteraceae bacterium]|jgi:ferric-dicitrate binding protein FerR (iron transport regulator)|nr:hypothetical protein [Solirubrobacteraceae bacterium]